MAEPPLSADHFLTDLQRPGVQQVIRQNAGKIIYSEKYNDDVNEYRHVVLPKEMGRLLPKGGKILSEREWRGFGVQQSLGWEHYLVHSPEIHILLFKRPLNYKPPSMSQYHQQA